MTHEKIIKRDNGSRVKISVSLTIDFSRINWQTDVWTCAARKRTWINSVDHNSWDYRSMDMQERGEYRTEKQLEVVTRQEIYNTKRELVDAIIDSI